VPNATRRETELGDYQTPIPLVDRILDRIGPIDPRWTRVLEPTCGRGSFIERLIARERAPAEIIGIELQKGHLEAARAATEAAGNSDVTLIAADLFKFDLRKSLSWRTQGPLLVIGNPPWVTNAALGGIESGNRPERRNLLGLKGLSAMTGSSNFDLAEAIWIKLAVELAVQEPEIAMLCKIATARRILETLSALDLGPARAEIVRIDARRWFQAAVHACLLRTLVRRGVRGDLSVPVFGGLDALEPEAIWQLGNGSLSRGPVADLGAAEALTWRQGIKHDAVRVMELRRDDAGRLVNGYGEVVDVESEYLFPILKSSDLFRGRQSWPRRWVLVTQRSLGQDTSPLEKDAPRLWRYLTAHAPALAARKSSVYRGRPAFSMFGIGEYTFARFKVAVAGMYSEPRFRLVSPIGNRPVMLDDTCYFVPCDTQEEAADLARRLNAASVIERLRQAIFPDAKRPVTKRVLQHVAL
jgi:tRNA1(Val) A37 N6-methylase TrmN6